MRNSLLKRTLILTVTTIIVSCTIAFSSDQKRAVPIYTRLIMNDQLVTDRAYLIDNAVYYKLRTLVLAANFDLKLEDSSNTIYINTNSPYSSGQSDSDIKEHLEEQTADPSNARILVNNGEKLIKAYIIDGYNYFSIKDFAQAINVPIVYDQLTNTYTLSGKDITYKIDGELVPLSAIFTPDGAAAEEILDDNPPSPTPVSDGENITYFNSASYPEQIVIGSELWKEVTFPDAEIQYNLREENGVIIYYDRADDECKRLIPIYQKAAEEANVSVFAVDKSSPRNMQFNGSFFADKYSDGEPVMPTIYVTTEMKLDIYVNVKNSEQASQLFKQLSDSINDPNKGVVDQEAVQLKYRGRVVELSNNVRSENGLKPLAEHSELMKAAQYKCTNMIENNYYSHDSPTYGSGHNLINLFSIAYVFWGENIAAGQPTPESVMDAWMDSPGHAENILRPDFSHIGVGYSRSPMHGTLWSQEFITE